MSLELSISSLALCVTGYAAFYLVLPWPYQLPITCHSILFACVHIIYAGVHVYTRMCVCVSLVESPRLTSLIFLNSSPPALSLNLIASSLARLTV